MKTITKYALKRDVYNPNRGVEASWYRMEYAEWVDYFGLGCLYYDFSLLEEILKNFKDVPGIEYKIEIYKVTIENIEKLGE